MNVPMTPAAKDRKRYGLSVIVRRIAGRCSDVEKA
jgi:hypothetical protein